MIAFRAIIDLLPGEEITVNYEQLRPDSKTYLRKGTITLKAFKRPFKGLLKAFRRLLKGLVKAF